MNRWFTSETAFFKTPVCYYSSNLHYLLSAEKIVSAVNFKEALIFPKPQNLSFDINIEWVGGQIHNSYADLGTIFDTNCLKKLGYGAEISYSDDEKLTVKLKCEIFDGLLRNEIKPALQGQVSLDLEKICFNFQIIPIKDHTSGEKDLMPEILNNINTTLFHYLTSLESKFPFVFSFYTRKYSLALNNIFSGEKTSSYKSIRLLERNALSSKTLSKIFSKLTKPQIVYRCAHKKHDFPTFKFMDPNKNNNKSC